MKIENTINYVDECLMKYLELDTKDIRPVINHYKT